MILNESKKNEFLKLAGTWLWARQWALHNGELPFGIDLAGCMLGMNDCEAEMGILIEEMKCSKQV